MQYEQPKTSVRAEHGEQPRDSARDHERAPSTVDSREMPCPVCGAPMPDLKGGKATICPVCGFKDSCCY